MATTLSINPKALPAGLRVIVETLGVEQAIKLLTKHQGRVFYIPPVPDGSHEVVKECGITLARHWAKLTPMTGYQLPMAGKMLCSLRNQEICRALDSNECSIQDLVRRFALTRQQITNIYREHRMSGERMQLGLQL